MVNKNNIINNIIPWMTLNSKSVPSSYYSSSRSSSVKCSWNSTTAEGAPDREGLDFGEERVSDWEGGWRLTGVPGPRATRVSEEWNEDHGLPLDVDSDDSRGSGELLPLAAAFPSDSDTPSSIARLCLIL